MGQATQLALWVAYVVHRGVLHVASGTDARVGVWTYVTAVTEVAAKCAQLDSLTVWTAAGEIPVRANVERHSLSAKGNDSRRG